MGRALERKQYVVYLITNSVTGKVYVGKTGFDGPKRLRKHIGNALKRNLPGLLYNSIRKHGPEVFSVRELGKTSKAFINQLETIYILIFRSQDKAIGYNMTSGGDGGAICVGRKISEEHKAKVSASSTGRKWTPEQRVVLMAARKKQADERRGKPRPAMAGENNVNFGKKRNPEITAKIIATKKAKGLIGGPRKPPAKYKRIVRDAAWLALQPLRKEAARQKQLEFMAAKPHSEEARLKMQEASKKYWAEMKAKGGALSNTARTQSSGDVNVKEKGDSEECCSLEPFAISA
jgi:group I intron endonuclease